jgi:cysteinyl-tRNA synthetase
MKRSVLELCAVLGLKIEHGTQNAELRTQIEKLIAERETARQHKDFKRADEIRKQLKGQGIEIEDTPYGPKWSKV